MVKLANESQDYVRTNDRRDAQLYGECFVRHDQVMKCFGNLLVDIERQHVCQLGHGIGFPDFSEFRSQFSFGLKQMQYKSMRKFGTKGPNHVTTTLVLIVDDHFGYNELD